MQQSRILVVEDNHDVAGILGDFLEAKGAEVDFAANGLLGLKLASSGEFDLIILDLMLPKLDGLSVCRQLRESGIATPVLMLTALDGKQELLEGFKSGTDDYLSKPFDFDELEARLSAMLRRARGTTAAQTIQIGELELDPRRHQVQRNGQRLVLTPTCYQILELLMRQHPAMVRREHLIDSLWGEAAPDKDILRSHMYQLRNQLDKPFAYPMLVTVPKQGFRLQTQEDSSQ